MALKPNIDPFPTTEVFRMGDECLDDHYRLLLRIMGLKFSCFHAQDYF